MYKIEDLSIIKLLNKGRYAEVYLCKKGEKYYAAKKIEIIWDDIQLFEKEISILKDLAHQNIVKYKEIKKNKNDYYIVTEFINGGTLTQCLKKYINKNGKAFSEEIVQYLMKQIVNGIKYIHNKNIIHRDLKLDNIMVAFNNKNDINNLDMMKAKVKIIDFGFSCFLKKGKLALSAIGTPLYADPLILKKFNHNESVNSLGYGKEIDIWSLGILCYEMLMGHVLFNEDSVKELIDKVEKGNYQIPTNLSKEVVSFLNGMLQYDREKRLNINQLENHPFLKKRVSDFTKINVGKLSNKIKNDQLNINIKQNKSIWSIFNKEDEQKLIKISPTNDYLNDNMPIQEEKYKKIKTDKFHKKNIVQEFDKAKTVNYNKQYLFTKNFYGKEIYPKNKNQDNNINTLEYIEKIWINEQKMNNKPIIDIPEYKDNNNFVQNSSNLSTINTDNNYNNFYNSELPNTQKINYCTPYNEEEDKNNHCCCCIL